MAISGVTSPTTNLVQQPRSDYHGTTTADASTTNNNGGGNGGINGGDVFKSTDAFETGALPPAVNGDDLFE